MGHQPLILSLTRPRHLTEAAASALATPHDAIVITSAETVRALDGLDLSSHLNTAVYAVGAVTADELRRAGFRHVKTAEGTGESLARLLIDESRTNLLYLAGSPRSPDLEQGLAGAGIRFSTVVSYEMLPLQWTQAEWKALEAVPHAVLLYSSEAARLFSQQPFVKDNPHFWENCHAICLSAKIARSLGDGSKMTVLVASEPTEEALFALLS